MISGEEIHAASLHAPKDPVSMGKRERTKKQTLLREAKSRSKAETRKEVSKQGLTKGNKTQARSRVGVSSNKERGFGFSKNILCLKVLKKIEKKKERKKEKEEKKK